MHQAQHQSSTLPYGAPARSCGAPVLLRPWHADGESPQERETDWFPELHFEMEHADPAAPEEEACGGVAQLSA